MESPLRLSDPVHTPCSDNPCENGGKCMALDYGDYKCQCPHDFGGMHCEGKASKRRTVELRSHA